MSRAATPARVPAPRLAAGPAWPPTSRRSRPARRARARRNCCGSPTRTSSPPSRRRPRTQLLAAVEAISERRLRGELAAAGCWALLPPRRALPAGLRDAADAPWALIGRGDPALLGELADPAGVVTVVGARRASSYGREVARELGRDLAAAGIVVVSGLAFGIDACAHRGALEAGPHGRRARLRRRRRLPGGAPLALAAGPRARPRPLRAAAGNRRLALDLPGPQPDHGRAGRDDRRGRGGGALRLADHGRPRRRPRPRPRRGAGPGQLARLGRAQQPAGRRRLPRPRRPGRARRDARARASRRAERARPAARPGRRRVLEAVERGRGHLRRGRRRPRPLRRRGRRGPRRPRGAAATSPARCSASTPTDPAPAGRVRASRSGGR